MPLRAARRRAECAAAAGIGRRPPENPARRVTKETTAPSARRATTPPDARLPAGSAVTQPRAMERLNGRHGRAGRTAPLAKVDATGRRVALPAP
jgi:hypothetical protein